MRRQAVAAGVSALAILAAAPAIAEIRIGASLAVTGPAALLGDPEANGGLVVRIWWKSWVTFIWYGTIVMVLGGILSLSDRRLRIGAPNRARAKKSAEAAA